MFQSIFVFIHISRLSDAINKIAQFPKYLKKKKRNTPNKILSPSSCCESPFLHSAAVSESATAGGQSPDGCHRWVFPSELQAPAQHAPGRVRSQAFPWNVCCNRKQKEGPCPHQ